MATARAQKKWRDKHRLVKKQLNVMARKATHDYLIDIAERFALRGKGEAVTFACFVTQALIQRADYNTEAARMIDALKETYHRDRDIYTA
jgi:DNA-binding ferritin-like protein